ncbi:RNA demethylase [Mycobacterium phage prophi68-1]|nr:RNA demethylase [Mycobacterium phage prophi68-1]QSM05098.1 RNA demethylase [Mycobacterium phage prophiGD04-1]
MPERSPLSEIFCRNTTIAAMERALGVSNIDPKHVDCWANRYRVGERIAPHRDSSGSVQFIVCLKAPIDLTSGGILHLKVADALFPCPLTPGDALLWEATSIEHWTTPLVATQHEPTPERITLVGRYYL